MPAPKFCPWCGTGLGVSQHGGLERPACPACAFVHWGNPTPVVAAIVELPEGVVLVRQASWPPKLFGLVTGFLEAGETPEAGCLREVKEELSLDATLVRLIGAYAFEMRNELIVAYHVKAQGTPVLSDELEAHKVVPVEKLRPWEFGTGLAVRDWLAAR